MSERGQTAHDQFRVVVDGYGRYIVQEWDAPTLFEHIWIGKPNDWCDVLGHTWEPKRFRSKEKAYRHIDKIVANNKRRAQQAEFNAARHPL